MTFRADVYQYVNGYDFSKTADTYSFLDALVYACKKPQDNPRGKVIRYERPEPATNALELAFDQLSVGQEANARGEETPSSVSTLTASLAGTAVSEATPPAAQGNLGNIPLPPVRGMFSPAASNYAVISKHFIGHVSQPPPHTDVGSKSTETSFLTSS